MSILKRVTPLLLCVVMLVFVLVACDTDSSEETPSGTTPHTHTPADAEQENYVDSTCTQTGSYDEVVYCSACEEEISRTPKTVDKKAHDFNQKAIASTYLKDEATCTESAVYFYSCACGAKGTTTFTAGEPNGHNYGTWINEIPATCEGEGTLGHYHCNACGKNFDTDKNILTSLVISAKGHNYGTWINEIPATCEGEGTLGHYHCDACGKDFDTNKAVLPSLVIPTNGHNYGTWIAEIPATCEGDGTLGHYHCDACGKDFDANKNILTSLVISLNGHNYGTWINEIPATCEGDGTLGHYHCDACGKDFDANKAVLSSLVISANGHTYGTWINEIPATCEGEGTLGHYHCDACGKDFDADKNALSSLVIPANGHEHESAITAPTCTAKGYTTYTCHCGDTYTANEVAANGHSYDEWIVTKDPTETAKGEKRRDCKNCDHYETEVIAELEHDHSRHGVTILEAIAPTCTATGLTEGKKCSGCGEVLVAQQTVPANGHTWGAWAATKAPTCTEKGTERRDCEHCDHYETNEIKANGHTNKEAIVENKVEATCTADGNYDSVIYCSVCNGEVSREVKTIGMLGHDYSTEWTIDLEPTCTEKGSKSHHCSRCSDQTDVTEIAANGHNYEAVVTEPTCTEKGYTTYTCHCGDTYTDNEVPATGHSYSIAWEQNDTHHWHKATCEHTSEISEKIEHDYGTDYICDTCGYDSEIHATEISLNVNNTTLIVGNTQSLIATITPANTTNQNITWSSSDSLVATVDVFGNIVAKAPGIAVIVATTSNGKTVSCTVIVQAAAIEADKIELNQTCCTLEVGDMATLHAIISPNNTTNQNLTWGTSNANIVSVYNGKIIAVSVGTATVTATTANGKTATCTVTVTAASNPTDGVTGIELNASNLLMTEYQEAQLFATLLGTNTQKAEIIWASSDYSVAMVSSDGTVCAMSEGSVLITAMVNGTSYKATCYIVVQPFEDDEDQVSAWESDAQLSILPEPNFGTCTNIGSGGATFVSVTREDAMSYVDVLTSIGYSFKATANTSYVYAATAKRGDYTVSIGWTLNGLNFSVLVQGSAGGNVGGGSGSSENVNVTYVVMDKTNVSLIVGNSTTIGAMVTPDEATDKTLTWSSSDTSVAVIRYGIITAVGKGTATITATSSNGKKATCTVTVYQVVSEITLNKNEITLEKNGSETLTATILPTDADDKTLTWKSSNPNVATVQNGVITAVGKGTATITATSANGKTATCTVTVIVTVTNVVLDKESHNMAVGDELVLHATVNPTDATDPSVRWSSSDEGVATVDAQGKITAVSAGTATITVTTANGLTDTCTITVASVAINLNETALQIMVGNSQALTAIFTPAYTMNQAVIWSSSNTSIATVENGVITAVKSGTVTITATAVAGGSSATCTVTVVPYEIFFATLEQTEDGMYGKVSNSTTAFSFKNEITLNGNATYVVSRDIYGMETVVTKTVPLNEGNNTFYIIVVVDDETTCYPVTIRRRPMHTVTFKPENGEQSIKVQVEEDHCVTAPDVVYLGHTLTGWNYDFTQDITESITLTAQWEVREEMKDFTFTANASTCTITGVTDATKAEYIIPSYVTSIGENAFTSCTELTRLTIPANVTSIGSYAFLGCFKLVEICDLSAHVTVTSGKTTNGYIGYYATHVYTDASEESIVTVDENGFVFVQKENGLFLTGYAGEQTNITLPTTCNGVAYAIAERALYNNKRITGVTIGNGITGIQAYQFSGCTALQSVSLGNDVAEIGAFAFENCTALQLISFGTGIKTIGESAFDGCEALKMVNLADVAAWCAISLADESANPFYYEASLYVNGVPTSELVIPNGVTAIAPYAFYSCGITSLVISDSVETIGESAFRFCLSLESVKLGNGITTISDWAFTGCTALHTLDLGSRVQAIGSNAFAACEALNKVVIPNTATSIGTDAFKYCYRLIEVCNLSSLSIQRGSSGYGGVAYYAQAVYTSREEAGEVFTDINGFVFYENGETCYFVGYVGDETELILPESCNGKNYMINQYAFYNCESLTSITIPNSVTSIGSYAFYSCNSLTSITFAENSKLMSIGSYAFHSCESLTSITIPDSVTSIGSSAFSGCTSLKSMTLPFVGNAKYGTSYTHFGYIFGASTYSGHSSYIPTSLKTVVITGGTSIGNYAFYGCTSLTSITIGNSVTSIGERAFYGCRSLTSITIPNSVTSIDDYAFSGCSSLTSITFAENSKLTSIGDQAFYSCSKLTSITIPSSVTSIGWNAFHTCESLTSITIPDSVRSVGMGAFAGCTSLESMTLPFVGATKYGTSNTHFGYIFGASSYSDNDDCVPTSLKTVVITGETHIGDDAFYRCSSLTSVTIGNSVTSIGSSAFYGCTSLIQKENGVSYVDKWVIDCDSNVTSVTLRNDTVGIGSYAFSGCSRLTSITIPDSVTSIGSSAFYNCSKLTSVTIGNSVKSIGSYAFSGCSSLTSITIPDGVTSIGEYAFEGCSSLTSITIPDSVTSIGASAFSGCSYLESITLPFVGATKNGTSNTHLGYIFGASSSSDNDDYVPNSLKTVVITGGTSIGEDAFYGCRSLTSITISDSVTSIGSYAFYNCSKLTSVTIGNSVTCIGSSAFYGCSSLTSVYITDIAKWCAIEFSGYDSNPLYYAGNLYLNGNLVTELIIPDSVTSIGSYAFRGCSSLTSITIPDNVTSIGSYVFAYCDNLKSVTIGNSVTSIGNGAFYDCTRLTGNKYENAYYLGNNSNPYLVLLKVVSRDISSCTIHENTRFILSYAFSGYSSLTSIVIPDSVTSIGEDAFDGCTSLASITIPDSVTSIGDRAFYNCTSLASITIPDGVTSIGSYAFYNCSSLTSITIPDGVTSIGSYAFYCCSNLTSVTIPDSVTSIGSRAFYDCSSLTSVYYAGTAEDWSKISIHSFGNSSLTYATRYYYSETKPTTTGKYWHYVDGVPTKW